MKNTQFVVYIEQDEDGIYIGSIPSIPGCHAQGKTQEEMLSNLADVVKLCLRNLDKREIEHNRFVWIQNIDLSYA